MRLTSMRNLGALFAAVSAVRAQQQPGEEASPSSGGEKRGKKTKRAKRSAKESQEQEVARRIMQKLLNNGASLLYRLIAQVSPKHPEMTTWWDWFLKLHVLSSQRKTKRPCSFLVGLCALIGRLLSTLVLRLAV